MAKRKNAAAKESKPAGKAASGKQATAKSESTSPTVRYHKPNRDNIVWWTVRLLAVGATISIAYNIRLYAINEYGLVIHEFDPWFNYRATEYLHQHGLKAFFEWYDYMSWYPLGRPIGSTIYPGMQMTSEVIWQALQKVDYPMSINDICCYVPAWFGVSASLFVGLLAAECSGSRNAGAMAALVMSMIPAHTMRSVGGGYDNESIAVTAMSMTFYFWCRSLRNDSSWPIGVIAGLAYVYMVAAWGGYVFVINLVGVHAILLVFLGRFDVNLHHAYSLFYAIGTFGAIQIPVVGLTPLKSLEQLGPFGVFGIMQILYVCEVIKQQRKLDPDQLLKLRFQAFFLAGAAGAAVAVMLYPTGYFGPLSSRVRGLFVQHTRTGNPLVDSVAEHQAASANAYWQYLSYACYLSIIGYVRTFFNLTNAGIFLPVYASIAYFFSAKMVRLIILLGPIASALSGSALALILEWSYDQFLGPAPIIEEEGGKKSKKGQKKVEESPLGPEFDVLVQQANIAYEKNASTRKIMACFLVYLVGIKGFEFFGYCNHMAQAMSNPSIMFNAQLRDGTKVLVDDYREAYFWLRDNTPTDARVMAWWDYGYQLTGIANRTSIADGNTWNHEHIATLGRCLVSETTQAHHMIRHLADYVLVWTGGGGDDLAKMPHIARIANSVYPGLCEGPLCKELGYLDRQGTPSPFMAKSLLYKLHSGGQRPGVTVDKNRFTNVFNSKYNKVRIWKVENVDEDSKKWVDDPKNRKCDPNTKWICRGDYPPAFKKFVAEKKDFQQLEDFNTKTDKDAIEYQKKYHAEMSARSQGKK